MLFGAHSAAGASARHALVREGWNVIDGADLPDAASRFDALIEAQGGISWSSSPSWPTMARCSSSSLRGCAISKNSAWSRPGKPCASPPVRSLVPLLRCRWSRRSRPARTTRVCSRSAARRSLRVMVAAAAVEFAAREAPLRVNLLEYDVRHFDNRAFERALLFLASPASSFVTGTHLALPGAAAAHAGRAS